MPNQTFKLPYKFDSAISMLSAVYYLLPPEEAAVWSSQLILPDDNSNTAHILRQ